MTIARKAVVLGALLPALALSLFALPALAQSGDDTVVIINDGAVINQVGALANSGGNFAGAADGGDGDNGGSGGDGGDISQGGDYDGEEYDVDDSATGDGGAGGNGGNGGNAGTGGSVASGEAVATAGSYTVLNANSVSIRRGCGCDGEGSRGDATVVLYNGGLVFNSVGALANSGENAATGADGGNGASGGSGGDGGDIEQDGSGDYDVDDSETGNGARGGNGGSGGTGGTGGSVSAGRADALAFSETFANVNDVDVTRR